MRKIPELDFSKIEWWIEKSNKIKKKLDFLKNTLVTREEVWKTSKELLWFNLEESNYLARIDEVAWMCNKKTEQFLKICWNSLDLKFS